ncbi:capsid protein [Capybara virus 12_cap1_103]|nr:capsid protein [Capybara virus 12_cap1_103]
MSKHINWSSAFNYAAGSYLFNSVSNHLRNRSRGSYSLGNGQGMAKFRRPRLNVRYRGRTKTRLGRRKFRRGNRLVKRVRRISRVLHRKGLKSIEIKYLQGQLQTPNTVAGTGAISTLLETGAAGSNGNRFGLTSQIVQGTTREQRVGNKVFLRHVRVRALLQASSAATAASEVYFTIMFVRVKDAQGSTGSLSAEVPYLQNIFEYIGSTSALSTAPNGQNGGRGAFVNQWNYINARFKDDFQILKKKTYRIGKFDGNPPMKVMFKFNMPIFKPAYWDDAGNPADGHVYCYYWVDQVTANDGAVADGDRAQMWLSWRASYTDC